ncbi:MAG: hypothetical protein KIS84_00140 [Dokdonella sp.]|nr:hypothetical protein [Dokdonella sp.]
MNLGDAEAAGLLGAGSRASRRLLVAGPEAAITRFAEWARANLPADARLSTIEDAQQNLRTAFERGESFLRLAALLAALLSGIAVALAAQRFARRKTEDVALLRCLGASRGEIVTALCLQLGLLAVPACLVSLRDLKRGGGFPRCHNLLPGAVPSLSFGPATSAFAIGLAVLFGFALPPLLRLRDVEPMRVFRQDLETRVRRFDALYLLPFVVAGLLILVESGSARLASTLAAGLASVASATIVVTHSCCRILRTAGH